MGCKSLLVPSAPTAIIPSKIAASLAPPPRPQSLCFPRALTVTDSVVFRVKSNSARIKLASSIRCALTPELKTTLDKVVTSHKVLLFMKGTKDFPQCGFSQTVVQILKSLNVPFETVNILENEFLRQGLKEYSSWPTFPQLYIDGEFFGGCDIAVEAYKSGELQELVEKALLFNRILGLPRDFELEQSPQVIVVGQVPLGYDVVLQLDPFLNELTSMFESSTEKGSIWVTLKRSSLKSKVQRNKMTTTGEPIEYRCLIRATDGKKTISTSVGAKDHQRFQASYATILKAHMTTLKKRERKDKKKAAEGDKKEEGLKKNKKA
ncbi:unnamed protein product [Dovyalis caffra]|uniref:Signal recognition particle 14 kDa protein n=1 Tax=Dovyalis caffra TaxID=77055 RepID=A0AAV1S9Z3_9ROSI|nr:unnamed protein product [Dovyalis caffra]